MTSRVPEVSAVTPCRKINIQEAWCQPGAPEGIEGAREAQHYNNSNTGPKILVYGSGLQNVPSPFPLPMSHSVRGPRIPSSAPGDDIHILVICLWNRMLFGFIKV